MDSALTPREIQARIRAGEPLSDVARAAGMAVDWVEPFAGPVFAEREFIAQQAQSHPVRRGAETIAHRTLGQVVEDRLASRRVDADTVVWDAWKIEARRWLVRVDDDSGKSHREARFIYDASGRFSTADNDDARWLLCRASQVPWQAGAVLPLPVAAHAGASGLEIYRHAGSARSDGQRDLVGA